MAYEKITRYNSPNYTPAASVPSVFGRSRTVNHIAIHWWGEPAHQPQFDGVVAYLCNGNRPGPTSAHAVIEAGRCAWIVNGWDAAWHAGNAEGNATGIGLELNPRCWESDYRTAAEVIADLWIDYKTILPLKPHNHWQLTECPGDKSGRGYNLTKLYNMAMVEYNKKTGKTPAKPAPGPVKKPAPAPAVKPASNGVKDSGIKWRFEKGDTLWSAANYLVGSKAANAYVAKIKTLNGLKSNTVKVGQVLKMPTGIYWITDPGDTLDKIGRRYGVHPDWLKARNAFLKGVNNGAVLHPGQTILVG